jgi:hypothetical protein
MENNRLGCINRDYNACMNIKKIFQYYLNNGGRPLRYCRDYKIEKEANHSLVNCQMVSSRIISF